MVATREDDGEDDSARFLATTRCAEDARSRDEPSTIGLNASTDGGISRAGAGGDGLEDVSEEREGDETTEEDAKDADEGEAGTNSDGTRRLGIISGRGQGAAGANRSRAHSRRRPKTTSRR